MITGSATMFIPYTYTFALGRFLCGVAVGAFSMLSAQYISEFTPTELSGKMGTLNQFACMLGLLIAYSICLLLPVENCGENIKFYVLSIFTVPGLISIIQLTIFIKVFTRESPY